MEPKRAAEEEEDDDDDDEKNSRGATAYAGMRGEEEEVRKDSTWPPGKETAGLTGTLSCCWIESLRTHRF